MSDKIKIGLDEGHGPNTYPPDKGVPSMPEYEFNSAVAQLAKPLLEQNGFEVYMAQTSNKNDVDLNTRTAYYNRNNVEFVMSIHADANSNPAGNGFWSFNWHTSTQGRRLAQVWVNELRKQKMIRYRSMQESKRNHWTNFAILRDTAMPAVLMEHGFMTNPQDLIHLRSNEYRQFCAEALARAACAFKGIEYESGKPMTPPPSSVPDTLYRVRSSWGDEVSQEGAFNEIDNAKALADETNKNVYDEDGELVYRGGSTPEPAPTPPKPSKPESGRLLRLTRPLMNGNDVKEVQSKLRAKGFDPGSVDGWYGPKSEDAVLNFQRAAKIQADGIVGPQTISALDRYEKPKSWNLPNTVLRRGSGGSSVRLVQQACNELYFHVGTVDGRYGPKTEDAVRRFQSIYLPSGVDGVYGPKTRAEMMKRLN